MRIVKSNHLLSILYHTAFPYPSPATLTYLWNFGIFALLCLVVQIVSGIFLSMHFIPEQEIAFISVERIMRDVKNGWLLRYTHSNGASMFFFVIYGHLFRNMYYASYTYPRYNLWITGVLILFLMIVTGFLGYVLPWGQMSYWAATVITNFVSAVPIVGHIVVVWLWGGYSVGRATLNRFFSLHYLLPFILSALVMLHLFFLHDAKSNNPMGISFFGIDNIPFYPYFIAKDFFSVMIFFMIFSFFVFFAPNYLGHPDNYIPANPLVTPTHIVPEWYFLTFYAILRSVPDKLIGVFALLGSIFVLLLTPFFSRPEIRSGAFKPISKIFFYFFLMDWLTLAWIGGKPAEFPYVGVGQYATIGYFSYFFLVLPFINEFEEKIMTALKESFARILEYRSYSLPTFESFFIKLYHFKFNLTTFLAQKPKNNFKNKRLVVYSPMMQRMPLSFPASYWEYPEEEAKFTKSLK